MGGASEILENNEVNDGNKDLFTQEDLKKFTDLVNNEKTFQELIEWYDKDIELSKIDWLTTIIETEIKKPENQNQKEIFEKKYTELTSAQQDLYEICILWAMVKNEIDKIPTPDFKKLAKTYYETIYPKALNEIEKTNEEILIDEWYITEGGNETQETQEKLKKENIEGTYTTASSNMKEETITTIENKTTIEKGNTITEASINVSAGADLRKMNEETAKADRTAKIAKLETYKSKYTNPENKTTIDTLIQELSTSNIESKITDLWTDKKDNKEQNGNRYLIGARIAEGFIQALDKLVENPEPKLITKIDRDNCVIGRSQNNNDVEADRNISINLSLKTQSNIEKKEEEEKEEEEEEEEEETIIENKDITKNKDDKDNTQNIPTNKWVEEDNKGKWEENTNQENSSDKIIDNPQENKETIKNNPEWGPDIFVAERIRIALSKEFKRNGKTIDKDKDIQKITNTKTPNKVNIRIDNKDIEFSYTKIEKDWNFDKDEKGVLKTKEEDKKYYETKLETTQLQEKFKVYDVKENDKNITTTLNEEKTKEAFKKWYTFKDTGYSLDEKNIAITKDTMGDLQSIKTNIIFKLPQAIIDNQKDKNIANDTIQNIIFDKNGEIKAWSGNTYQKYSGVNKFSLITEEKDVNDNYKKEDKNLNYNVKTIGNTIHIINDEVRINPTTKLTEKRDSRMGSEIENANKTQETFKEYSIDLDTNFKKRQINALGGNKYQLLVIPKIKGVDQDNYITIPFSYNYNTNTQTKYFSFENNNINIPEKNKEGNYFVIKNMYYRIDIPTDEQIAINPRVVLDYKRTKEEAIKKTDIPNNNQIKEAQTEKIDNSNGWRQDRNIALLNNITYNSANYLDFSLDENNQEIEYSREISLDEVLWYDLEKENKLILGTIKFDGNGEIKESKEDRYLKINKKNQTLEIKDIFGRNKPLTIPFEIKNGVFVIGKNSNPDAEYITDQFVKQKENLKNRIYDEKSTITKKINGQIKEIWTQRANEFPWLALDVPTKWSRQLSNTETINAIEYLKGPTSTGLYYLNINNGYKQENKVRPEEFLYFKVTGTDVKLTDMNWKEIEETYIQSNNEYKPGKWLIKVDNNLRITSIKDTTEQESGYPNLSNEPETLKTYLTKTIEQAKPTNYDKEVSGQYLRIFWNSKIGHITSLPIKTKENNPNKYLYNKEWIKETTSDEIAKDLRDFDRFWEITTLNGLNEAELKETFVAKYKSNEKIDKAIRGDNIRIKNNEGKYEYWNISSNGDGDKIRFEENTTSKEIQEKVIDDMKKDLAIIWSIEKIKFKYRRDDEKRKILTDWDKAGNRTIQDVGKQTIQSFMNAEKIEDKKINLQLLGPSKETITLDINDNIYKNIESKDLENGYYKNLFESKLGNEADKEIKIQNETYKIHIESNKEKTENQIIFESQVQSAQ